MSRHLRDVLGEDPSVIAHLTAGDLRRLFDPLFYQGVAQIFIDRMMASAMKR